ncbi:unnamed protein product [Cuscuta epithymum]|uniref:Glycosyltransferase 61 catalytic domain-containing protein n=1 Tax=Cuscuta epithymum TaxID=186058 RepID=A0AAV0C4C4_9ASTE|nr:unnamed protein product [Cuscuta epithymum]
MEKKGSNYEAIMARSFSRQERSKMGWWACLAFFLLAFAFCFFFKPPPPPYTTTNLASYPVSAPVEVRKTDFLNVQATKHFETNIPPQPYSSKAEDARPICKTHPRSDIFHAKGDIRVLSTSNSSSLSPTIDVVSNVSMSWNIKPYARKLDPFAMRNVRNITINRVSLSSHHHQLRNCTRKYNIPAVVFSLAGYTGNLFHDLSDVILPLFLTTHEFHREVHFLVVDYRQWWVNKYKNVLQGLTKYDIINLDNIGKDDVICFPRITVGLKANKEFSIDDDIVSGDVLPLSMKNFTNFLRSVYHLKRDVTIKTKQPRLLIISRSKTRRFLNIDEIATMALGLGFEVVAQETGVDMNRVSRFVNKFDAVVGVHGAGLSNMVFLPENAVVVQVVGLGMDGIAKTDYELPSLDMGLRYLEYKIGVNESSLIDKYPMGHDVFTNRSAISSKGWDAFREVYLDNQDVKLDVDRFRGTLLKVQELLHT